MTESTSIEEGLEDETTETKSDLLERIGRTLDE